MRLFVGAYSERSFPAAFSVRSLAKTYRCARSPGLFPWSLGSFAGVVYVNTFTEHFSVRSFAGTDCVRPKACAFSVCFFGIQFCVRSSPGLPSRALSLGLFPSTISQVPIPCAVSQQLLFRNIFARGFFPCAHSRGFFCALFHWGFLRSCVRCFAMPCFRAFFCEGFIRRLLNRGLVRALLRRDCCRAVFRWGFCPALFRGCFFSALFSRYCFGALVCSGLSLRSFAGFLETFHLWASLCSFSGSFFHAPFRKGFPEHFSAGVFLLLCRRCFFRELLHSKFLRALLPWGSFRALFLEKSFPGRSVVGTF